MSDNSINLGEDRDLFIQHLYDAQHYIDKALILAEKNKENNSDAVNKLESSWSCVDDVLKALLGYDK